MRSKFLRASLLLGLVTSIGLCLYCSYRNIGLVRALFYPPERSMQGSLPADSAGKRFDHADFDRLLRGYVSDRGFVQYGRLADRDAQALDAYVRRLAGADIDSLSFYEKLALYVNAYNAFTLKLMIEHRGVASIRDIPQAWDLKQWNLGGKRISLNELEHDWIRGSFAEPRVHFVLVCAAESCPWLRNEAYSGARLASQFTDQTNRFFSRAEAGYSRLGDRIFLSEIMDWYMNDFTSNAGGLVEYLVRHHPDAAEREYLAANKSRIRIEFSPYSWKINGSW